jgi:hypothetical protein
MNDFEHLPLIPAVAELISGFDGPVFGVIDEFRGLKQFGKGIRAGSNEQSVDLNFSSSPLVD